LLKTAASSLTAALGPGPLATVYDVTSFLLLAVTLILAVLAVTRRAERRQYAGLALLLLLLTGIFIVGAPIILESFVARKRGKY